MHAACPSTKRKLGISNFDLLLIFQQRPWWHERSAAAVHTARTIGERTVSQPFAGTDGLSENESRRERVCSTCVSFGFFAVWFV